MPIAITLIEKTTTDQATLYVSSNIKQDALDLIATNPDAVVTEVTVPVPLDLTNKSNITDAVDTVLGDIGSSPDTTVTPTYETSGNRTRLTKSVTSSSLVGFKIVETRIYKNPINHAQFNAIESVTLTLEAV
jgi:hypothetical protein